MTNRFYTTKSNDYTNIIQSCMRLYNMMTRDMSLYLDELENRLISIKKLVENENHIDKKLKQTLMTLSDIGELYDKDV